MQHVDAVSFEDVAVDPRFVEENFFPKNVNAASERSSACIAANQDISLPTAT